MRRLLPASLILPQLFKHSDKPEPATERRPEPTPEPTPERKKAAHEILRRHPLAIGCPRCKAPEGKRCEHRTLGRHKHHMARIEALQARLAETPDE